jgi:5'-methylthioadenosine phosphorylase
MRIGVLIGSIQPEGLEGLGMVETPYGKPSSPILQLEAGNVSYRIIARHSLPPKIPPHMVNHRANIWALKEAGATSILSICSTGALSRDIKVPSLAVPEDYIELTKILSFFDGSIHHATPSLDQKIRRALIETMERNGIENLSGGIYVQTSGPRLETKAEVKMMASWGDYVGMNMASEATLSTELGLPVAGLITVDNYANGILDEELDFRNILTDARSNWDAVRTILLSLPDNL